MHFVDECELSVQAGDGGDGAIAFRREKFVPLGGPAGGDGGRGGDIVFVGDGGRNTLSDLAHIPTLRALSGENGSTSDCNGRGAKDLEVQVPLGTVVRNAETGELLGEVTAHLQRLIVARAGAGGRGNRHFSTSTERAPRRAEPGGTGEHRKLHLELRVMADVGLLGFPNVGKSTFIRAISRAKPKVANYPFTTLIPHLGVVTVGDAGNGLGRNFVVADIPGLVPGAAQGHGLGHRFLRHVERTRVLLHMVTLGDEPERDPISDYQALRHELAEFDPELALRPEIVVLSQADRTDVREAHPELHQRFQDELGVELGLVSAVSHQGLQPLLEQIYAIVAQGRSEDPNRNAPVAPTTSAETPSGTVSAASDN
jgi:GTP-binding protein